MSGGATFWRWWHWAAIRCQRWWRVLGWWHGANQGPNPPPKQCNANRIMSMLCWNCVLCQTIQTCHVVDTSSWGHTCSWTCSSRETMYGACSRSSKSNEPMWNWRSTMADMELMFEGLFFRDQTRLDGNLLCAQACSCGDPKEDEGTIFHRHTLGVQPIVWWRPSTDPRTNTPTQARGQPQLLQSLVISSQAWARSFTLCTAFRVSLGRMQGVDL